MSKEFILKIYYDADGQITSTERKNEITRCRYCECSEKADSTGYVRNCSVWNRVVPLEGFCYLGVKKDV